MVIARVTVAWSRNRRRTSLRILIVGMAVLTLTVMGGVPGLLAPWTFLGNWPGHEFPDAHRWHDAQWGAMLAILLGGSLIGLTRSSDTRPALVQFVVAASAVLVLVNVPFNPLFLAGLLFGVFVPMAAIAYLHPRRADVLDLRPRGMPNVPLAVLSLVAGGVLAPVAWRYYDWQLRDLGGEHAEFQHWTITTTLAISLTLAGLLAATRRPGSPWLGVQAGAAYVYLGVAALRVPNHAGSWGTTGGWFAIAAGLGYVALTVGLERLIGRRGDSTSHVAAERVLAR